MSRFFYLPLLFAFFSAAAQEKTILPCYYYGKNIYIQNPANANNSGFCTDSVSINGQPYRQTELESSAYEIGLDKLGFQRGDSITVIIYHKSGCSPRVMNTDMHPPISQVVFPSIKADAAGVLRWTTVNSPEGYRPDFYIQQYRWEAWRTIGEMPQKKGKENSYEFPVSLHSGQNIFRVVVRTLVSNQPYYYSPADTLLSNASRVTMTFDSLARQIRFSAATDYELRGPQKEEYGVTVYLRGNADHIDLSGIGRGKYLLRFDNETREIRLPKKRQLR